MRSLLMVGIAVSLTGCSFVFSKGPPDDYRESGSFDCTGYAPPLVDALWASLNGLGAMVLAGNSDAEWKQQNRGYDRSTAIAVGLVWLALSGTSAIYGAYVTDACEEAKEDMLGDDRPPRRSRRRARSTTLRPPAPASESAPTNPTPSASKAAGEAPTPEKEAGPFQ